MSAAPREKIVIVGLGVIGGSLGMALHALDRYHIVGVDRDEQTLRAARETNAIDEGTGDLCRGVADADLVILAVPVSAITEIAARIRDLAPPSAIITDVGSTKAGIVAALEEIFPGRCLGGHPMTGSEYAGIGGADQYLFENAIYVLTPTERTSRRALVVCERLVGEIGAIPVKLSPQEHDLIVAAVSHLPYLLAVSLMNLVAMMAPEHPAAMVMAAGGFRDVTRVASGNPEMWIDICLSNRDLILKTSRQFRLLLSVIEECIARGDLDALGDHLGRARRERGKIPLAARGLLPSVSEVAVTLPDRPGSLAGITAVLGNQGINIVDIEILRIREGDGGTVRLAFKTDAEAEVALEALRHRGFTAKRR
jgi:prephenate dehydrogenase